MFETIKNKIVEICSVIIACCALFVAIFQASSTDYHNRLSVMPAIHYEISYSDDKKHLIYQIKNNGLGPAALTDLEYLSDDKMVSEHNSEKIFNHFTNKQNPALPKTKISFTKYRGSPIVMPGDAYQILTISLEEMSNLETQKIESFLDGIKIGTCYRSIYGDRFYIRSYNSPLPNNSCNYNGVLWIFGNPIRIHAPWNKTIPYDDLWK